jgi:3-phosphoshikimate 1-carboxyvinyltransferase
MVMALSLAAMGIEGTTEIDTAEAVKITYPSFVDDFKALGANIEIINQ